MDLTCAEHTKISNGLMKKFRSLSEISQEVLLLEALLYKDSTCEAYSSIVDYGIQYNAKKMTYSKVVEVQKELKQADFYVETMDYYRRNILDASKIHWLSVLALSGEIFPVERMLGYVNKLTFDSRLEAEYNGKNWSYMAKPYASDIRTTLLNCAIYRNDETPFLPSTKGNDGQYFNEIFALLDYFYAKNSLDLAWLKTRTPLIQAFLCLLKLEHISGAMKKGEGAGEIEHYFKTLDLNGVDHDYIRYKYANIYLVLGELELAEALFSQVKSMKVNPYLQTITTGISFLQGKAENHVIGDYLLSRTNMAKVFRKRNWFYDDIHGVFCIQLLLSVEKNPKKALEMLDFVLKQSHRSLSGVLQCYKVMSLLPLLQIGQGCNQDEDVDRLTSFMQNREDVGDIAFTFAALTHYLLIGDTYKTFSTEMDDALETTLKNGLKLVSHILSEVILVEEPEHSKAAEFLKITPFKVRFLNFCKAKLKWEYELDALAGVLGGVNNVASVEQDKRLLWLLEKSKKDVSIIAEEQRILKSGKWSKGRAISLSRLFERSHELKYITDQDRAALKGLGIKDGHYGSYSNEYGFDEAITLPALIGHPNIYHAKNKTVRIDLTAGEPELCIEQHGDGYKVILSHHAEKEGVVLEVENQHNYKVIDYPERHVKLNQLLSNQGLIVPEAAKDKLVDMIQHANKDIIIHAEISEVGIPEVKGNATLCVQLLPLGEALQVSLRVKPFGFEHPLYCPISQGKKHVLALVNEEGIEVRQKAIRDFDLERKAKRHFLKGCPLLPTYEIDKGEYQLDDVEDILEFISEMQTYKAEHEINFEWPQGESYKLKHKVDFKQLSLRVESQHNWFEYEGEVELDEGKSIDMKILLEALDQKNSRFIQLGEGEFIELTEAFKQQLNVLKTASDKNKIYHLGANVLDELVEKAGETAFDHGWENHVKRLKKMAAHKPEVPSTLQAELRDYQIDGFNYLSRLANWEIGACLADDMGLGKTVQAIAVMLEHAPKAPSLVIAPTSVCFNWEEEIKRFAPTLTTHSFYASKREELVNKLGKMDVLICSYGLLQQNIDLLDGIDWETVIVDEAQAIKNAQTKRWKAVMRLKSKHRLALTGTPIENHLGELWSIFNFVNPGLLGSLQNFQNKFSSPIESRQDEVAKDTLKTLVQPYILRRLKSEVLKELPAKTEQTIYIEPSKEELAFYDAVRQRALDNINSLDQDNKRFNILAEITKLRQACCHSSLVEKTVRLESSKLKHFKNLVHDLIENKHKVLVFSQYVRFLGIVKQYLDDANIDYQYIDGATTQAKRKKAVNDFQSGKGDVFLLSLKAGGSGLNLTAADYVIHLDPWWNPAVEDQASDRAHRLGQQRPVTVYRLVMKNTIEDKIIQMHKSKRDLASDLLSGQGSGGKMSDKDLMSLVMG